MIAEIPSLPGVMAYGNTRDIAAKRAGALALHCIAERLENGEVAASFNPVAFAVSFCGTAAVS